MAQLVHLNGPPGIGKSTLAALYTERHPGTLNLDIDRLHPLVGGWQDPRHDTHTILRPVALAMAATHLAGGRDVVLPQYLARLKEIERFEDVARGHGARFREVVLLDDKAPSIARFDRRADDTPVNRHTRSIVEQQGGADFLAAMYDRLSAALESRPDVVVVTSRLDAVEDAYDDLVRALARTPGP